MITCLYIEFTDEMNKLIEANSSLQRQIKDLLSLMLADYNDTKRRFPQEPEVRVKSAIH